MSPHDPQSPTAHDVPWLVAQLFATLSTGTTLRTDLRAALDAEGVHDRERFSLALLGVMAFARRAGCRPVQVRRFVACVVRDVASDLLERPRVETLVGRSAGFVDAIHLLHGAVDVDPSAVVAALDVADTLEVLDALSELDPPAGSVA